jgi:hypothetical protein
LSFLTHASIVDRVNLVASMLGIGAMAGGTTAIAARLLGRSADLANWTIYGSLVAGWFTVVLVLVGAVLGL